MAHGLGSALGMAADMGWQVLWPLILGFAVSGAIQAVVGRGEMARLLPDDRAGSIARATALGAASSSCSYAAVAAAGFAVEAVFTLLHLTPAAPTGGGGTAPPAFAWDATTWLNPGFGVLAALLVGRFLRTAGPKMLAEMG